MTYVTPTDLTEKESLDTTDKVMITDTDGLSQVVTADKLFSPAAARSDVIICNTAFNVAPEGTADIKASEYYEGLTVRVMFKNGHAGASFTFNLNGMGALPIYTIKDGEPALMVSFAIDRGTGIYNWYCQEYTILELIYSVINDIPVWLAIGNYIDENPTGTIMNFAGDTPPIGYLKCDYSAISRAAYPGLFKAIGTIYGSGNGSTTFNLPKCNNKLENGVELMTGERYTNGKPIYLRFTNKNISNAPETTWNLLEYSSTYKVEHIIDCKLDRSTDISTQLTGIIGTNQISFYSPYQLNGITSYILKYTKTTDTPSSLCYNQINSEGLITCIKV